MNVTEETILLERDLPGFYKFKSVVLALHREEKFVNSESEMLFHFWSFITGLAVLANRPIGKDLDDNAIQDNIEHMLDIYKRRTIMNILIIYAHPNPKSFNAEIFKQVQDNIPKSHTVQTLNLYAEYFEPVLKFDENHKRRDLAKLEETKKYRDLITWTDRIIFILPVWWSGMPAILKGFIDRVFTAGFAYSYKKIASLAGKIK